MKKTVRKIGKKLKRQWSGRYRIFNGKRYELFKTFKTKGEALRAADKLRGRGFLAIISPNNIQYESTSRGITRLLWKDVYDVGYRKKEK